MPRNGTDDVWLVVPLYNEAAVIADVIEHVLPVFPNVVCVDDGSTDDSAALAESAGAVVVRHPINLGQGAALQTGFDFARQDPGMRCVVTFDSDGQHRVEDALAAVERLRAGDVDVVLGSRFLDDRTNAGWLKRVVLRMAIAFTNVTTGMRLTDAHNGLRALTRESLGQVQIRQNRMAHASEIVSLIAKAKLRVAEIPVQIIYTEYSRSKGQSLWNSVNILIDLVLK
ncbi:MAG TPA: glycosyltransferase family 2 protein [Microbacteriaceae bacterium]|nr:glycosyltransferase family 2 protein [Microbacteriaceae bacterium]